MKTVLTALALTVSVVACGKKAQEVPLEPVTSVVEPAKVEVAPVVPAAAPVETAPAATTETK